MSNWEKDFLDAALKNDTNKMAKITENVVQGYAFKISKIISGKAIDAPFAIAALKICADSAYNTLDLKEKAVCDSITKHAAGVVFKKVVKDEGGNNE